LECRAETNIRSQRSRDMLQQHLDIREPAQDAKDTRTRE